MNLPPALKATILEQAGHGAEQMGASLPSGSGFEALTAALKASFVSGMHVALMVAGAALLLGALVALVFVRGGRPQQAHEVEQAKTPEGLLAMSADIPAEDF
jgi:hypothetical protein